MNPARLFAHVALVAGLAVSAMSAVPSATNPPETHPLPRALKDAARGLFHVGVALNAEQILEKDAAAVAVVDAQFDSISPENALKWAPLHPRPEVYDFALADKYVEFGRRRGLFVVGHVLMWHQQTPDWVFAGADGRDVTREELLRRLREHISTVVGRYRGKIHGWDVVNEAIDDSGKLRTGKPWYRILGEEGIFAAFAAAHEADPDAELYYNDYSLAHPGKRAAVLALVGRIRARGLRIDAVGTQEHQTLDWPSTAGVDAMLADFRRAGLKAAITELDVTLLPRPDNYAGADISAAFERAPELDPYRGGLPVAQDGALARRYRELFAAYLKHREILTRVTFWGVNDGNSWLNSWPIRGRTDYPLLFDRQHRPKAAFLAVLNALGDAQVQARSGAQTPPSPR